MLLSKRSDPTTPTKNAGGILILQVLNEVKDDNTEFIALNKFLKILWLVILLALLGGFGYIFYQKFGKLRQMRQQQIRYEKELSLLEDKVARLTREIDELSNNPARLEKLARDKLGLAGENEKIFIIETAPTPELQ